MATMDEVREAWDVAIGRPKDFDKLADEYQRAVFYTVRRLMAAKGGE